MLIGKERKKIPRNNDRSKAFEKAGRGIFFWAHEGLIEMYGFFLLDIHDVFFYFIVSSFLKSEPLKSHLQSDNL